MSREAMEALDIISGEVAAHLELANAAIVAAGSDVQHLSDALIAGDDAANDMQLDQVIRHYATALGTCEVLRESLGEALRGFRAADAAYRRAVEVSS